MVPSTVAGLFGDLRTSLDEHEVVSGALAHHVSETALRVLDRQVAEAVTGLLDIDLGGLVLDGWLKFDELRAAARRSVESSGEDEEGPLVEHRITSTHRPTVELFVGDVLVAVIAFDLEVHIDVHGVDAIVRGGRLVALRGGDVDLGARLSAEGQTIIERQVSCRIGALVPLAEGFPLLGGSWPARTMGGSGIGVRGAVVAGLVIVALSAAGLLSGIVAVPASAWPWQQAGIAGVVDPATAWNMRSGPSRSANAVGVVQPGQRVRVECLERGWAKLLVPRSGVFVDRRGLRLDSEPPDCSP